jgi:hypothetical protein
VQTTWTDDLHLVKAWELVSLYVVASKDEISKKYLQRIDDKFHCEMQANPLYMINEITSRLL